MFEYLRSPYYKLPSTSNLDSKLLYLIRSFIFYWIFFVLSGFLIVIVEHVVTNYLHLPSIREAAHFRHTDTKSNLGGKYFFIVVIFAPLVEELIFRFPLNLNKYAIGISLGIIVFRCTGDNIFTFDYHTIKDFIRLFWALGVIYLTQKYLPEKFLQNIREKYFKHFFYAIAALFALVHIQNFATSDYRLFGFYPIYVLPQFFMGLFIGNMRMQYGLFWGILLHALINLPSVLF